MNQLFAPLFYAFSFAFFMSLGGWGQSFKLYQNDTINKVDANKLKQGKWMIFGNMSSSKGYASSAVVETGHYKSSRKTGTWIKFFPNGNERSIIQYKNGRPNGHYKVFFENGRLEEEGNWSRNKNTGNFTRYYENGKKRQEFVFGANGKRNGVQKYYHDNGKLMIVGKIVEGKETGEFVEYNKDGSVKEKKYYDQAGVVNHNKTKSFAPKPKAENVKIEAISTKVAKVEKGATQNAAEKKTNPFNGNGKHTLYNKDKQISQKGTFKNYHLINGLHYKYHNGILKKIEIYKRGKYVGDKPIED